MNGIKTFDTIKTVWKKTTVLTLCLCRFYAIKGKIKGFRMIKITPIWSRNIKVVVQKHHETIQNKANPIARIQNLWYPRRMDLENPITEINTPDLITQVMPFMNNKEQLEAWIETQEWFKQNPNNVFYFIIQAKAHYERQSKPRKDQITGTRTQKKGRKRYSWTNPRKKFRYNKRAWRWNKACLTCLLKFQNNEGICNISERMKKRKYPPYYKLKYPLIELMEANSESFNQKT